MRRLIIADVHGILPAFEAVLAHAGHWDEVLFLGDIAECGPDPAACVDLLRSLHPRAIRGNHDEYTIARIDTKVDLTPPVDWGDWTYAQLSGDQLAYLAGRPSELWLDSCGRRTHVIHSVPGKPYLHPSMSDADLEDYFRDVPGEAVYCGHSHKLIDRVVNGRRYVCFRSVGQARDRDTRAGYAIEENGELTHFSVEYDVEPVARAIERIGLEKSFARRYADFTRTAYDRVWSREECVQYCAPDSGQE